MAQPPTHPVEGTTWLEKDWCLGSANRGNFWVQSRPLVAYWGGPQRPAHYVQARLIKDDYDFSSGLLYTVQDRGWVLGDTTLSAPAVSTPPLKAVPAAHGPEFILYRDGFRDNTGAGINMALAIGSTTAVFSLFAWMQYKGLSLILSTYLPVFLAAGFMPPMERASTAASNSSKLTPSSRAVGPTRLMILAKSAKRMWPSPTALNILAVTCSASLESLP